MYVGPMVCVEIIKSFLSYRSVPEDYKKNPGAVEAIAEQPGHPDNILIGYNRGLMVLWNKATPGAQQVSVVSVRTPLCIYNYTSGTCNTCRLKIIYMYEDASHNITYTPWVNV